MPAVEELDVDREFRRQRRRILHTQRDGRRYSVLYSPTPLARRLRRERDWVLIDLEEARPNPRWTIVTERRVTWWGEGRRNHTMKKYDPKLERLSTVLLVRGFALLAFAAIAVRWPEQSLLDAVRYAGGIAVFLGIMELGMSLAGHALLSVRAFVIGHAVTSITFGGVAAMARSLPVDQALVVATVWLGGYTAFLLLLAARLWYFRRMRDALLLWSVINVAAIAACLNLMGEARVSLLLGGALYTAVLGGVTIVAARWMRRGWMVVERVAVPS